LVTYLTTSGNTGYHG